MLNMRVFPSMVPKRPKLSQTSSSLRVFYLNCFMTLAAPIDISITCRESTNNTFFPTFFYSRRIEWSPLHWLEQFWTNYSKAKVGKLTPAQVSIFDIPWSVPWPPLGCNITATAAITAWQTLTRPHSTIMKESRSDVTPVTAIYLAKCAPLHQQQNR